MLVYILLGGLTSSIYNEVVQFFLIVFGFLPLMFVGLKPWEERHEPHLHSKAIAAEWTKKFQAIPGARAFSFGPPPLPGYGNVSGFTMQLQDRSGGTIDDLRHLVAGIRGATVYVDGDPDAGIWSAGMVQGLIHDIPTCAEIVTRIVAEAEQIIDARLARMRGVRAG